MNLTLGPVFAWVALGCLVGALRLSAALPAAAPDDGGIALTPGFRALVAADPLVMGKKAENTPEKRRFLAVFPNGDLYAKLMLSNILALCGTEGDGRFDRSQAGGAGDGDSDDAVAGVMNVLRKPVAKAAPGVSPAQIAGRRKEARSPTRPTHASYANLLRPL